jgi:hypothetical protein
MGGIVVHDEMDVEAARDIAFDLAQEAEELASAMTGIGIPPARAVWRGRGERR